MSQSQISAYISSETKELLERFSRARGLKKGFLIETALRHHLRAMQELPEDLIIPPRLVVSEKSGSRISSRIKSPPPPTQAMKDLFQHPGPGEEHD